MPESPLSQLLETTDFAWQRPAAAPGALTNIQWRADRCDTGSILFFQRFDDGKTDLEIYERYLARCPCAVLITNRMLHCFDRMPLKGIHVTRPSDWAEVIGRFCDLLYPLRPDLKFVGITGTNGKTTTLKYLESILAAQGQRVLSIGTLGVFRNGERLVETGFTSPPLIELRRLLRDQQDDCDLVIMEVSSHALDQGRVHGIPFSNAGWTNFTQDHLDYHRDETAYFNAKARIMDLIQAGGRLYCASPAVAERLSALGMAQAPVELVAPAEVGSAAIAAKPFLALEHNRANYALASSLADRLLGESASAYWRHLEAVDGRFECRVFGNRTLVVDFAHTPDALEAILSAIRAGFPEARVLTLFGCGGDRDQSKRPLMGAAVARHSDQVIITSDNPRTEAPEAIIADILPGIPEQIREVVVERPAAIARLFDLLAERPAEEPWVALIAGKGHERYIDQGGRKTHYSDQDEVARNAERLGWR
ncbi:UDP-N-acetylmuramoyl-L-alanyl-D-glutamate--2,6-diaminopimelate ligase [Thiorhodococcus mannitoliphagus]|uniref:UDP-N-acetylmuramoyl-L-alanyl-D-glutamate--2, 6-diaminopimelate ligase n=1 Tax=Thiorhodococcus mannitoliphagus TaxID=329406 RepID=A0A6P1DUF6_9GAMM|nr:UDP-N-acetylmuramoyl-L-alanyl-D-glutamate--2,6-diaminopimelate ligase [Thiorhodococcus mannitoliphagus]NEX21728.1 UDP-N-acetylmuramoyl-L-alanyl-D-glutamate--2,6-diaminopimelate ligase [Thiorhodococcus mannitoliphagus]